MITLLENELKHLNEKKKVDYIIYKAFDPYCVVYFIYSMKLKQWILFLGIESVHNFS